MIKRASIGRNSMLNLVGFTIPLLVGLLVVPTLTRELGPARFGLLGLAFALLEYSSLFNFGLGIATTRQVAASLAVKDANVSRLIVGSVLSQAALGSLGGVVLAAVAPVLARTVFSIPPALQSEAAMVFRVLALMVPATLVLLSLRGVLEAAHRFDLSNAIRIPSSVATFLIPAIAVTHGFDLPSIIGMLFITRLVICGATAFAVWSVLPGLQWRLQVEWATMRPLLAFGGWMSVSNVISPLLIYLDRFMLGALRGLTAVGYYTAPFDGVLRLLIIPASLMGAVFPSVSAMRAINDQTSIRRVFAKAVRNTSLILLAPTLVLAFFGPGLLRLWLGEAFAIQGEIAVRLLAVGVFINALAHIPSGFVTALGRPDVVARFHLLELLIHAPLAWFLISRFGVSGAALAWTIRVAVDAALLFTAALRMLRRPLDLPTDGAQVLRGPPAAAAETC